MSKYKFYLALENSKTPVYITEKIANAIIARTVPVYLGDPSVLRFINRDSIVFVDDFDQAIEEIKEIDQNYAYYSWKLR